MIVVRRFLPIITAILLLPVFLYSLSMSAYQRKLLPKTEGTSYILPARLLKITALEFDGLASDFLFFKALTFFGETLERAERPRVKEAEWGWIMTVLDASTDLDPYFYDPYYFANCILTWDAQMPKETNVLLAKGSRYRDWDWTIPYYMGFNEFFFLQNNAKASEYLMEGAKKPGAPEFMAALAVRMAYKGDRTRIAIAFVQETLKKTKDKMLVKELSKRLEVLRSILFLEQNLGVYREKYGALPRDLKELQQRGVISHIPVDPYNGEFYINSDGSVKSTSDMFVKQKK